MLWGSPRLPERPAGRRVDQCDAIEKCYSTRAKGSAIRTTGESSSSSSDMTVFRRTTSAYGGRTTRGGQGHCAVG